jgi:C1A family cysteine protease
MKKIFLIVFLFFLIVFIPLISAMANPAADYCKEKGYDYQIKTDSNGNQEGFCNVNGKNVGEWQLYSTTQINSAKEKLISSGKKTSLSERSYSNNKNLIEENKLSPQERGVAPGSFDWRDKNGENWISPIKDQGGCGACWAFSSVATVESKAKINLNNSEYNIDLSEQEVIDFNTGSSSCSGGYETDAFNFMKSPGRELHAL